MPAPLSLCPKALAGLKAPPALPVLMEAVPLQGRRLSLPERYSLADYGFRRLAATKTIWRVERRPGGGFGLRRYRKLGGTDVYQPCPLEPWLLTWASPKVAEDVRAGRGGSWLSAQERASDPVLSGRVYRKKWRED